MFKAARSKISSILNPVFQHNQKDEASKSRKRRFDENINENTVLVEVLPPVKKKKPTLSKSSFLQNLSVSNIFSYVMGNSSFMASTSSESLQNSQETSATSYLHKNKHVRTPLTQISKSKIFDLTLEADDIIDLEVTQESIDLTADDYIDIEKDDKFSKSKNENIISDFSENFSEIPRVKSTSLISESIRLDEQKRYKEIVSLYTNVSLPEYSCSISPNKTKSNIEIPIFDLTVDSIPPNRSFSFKSHEPKSPIIDLTKDDEVKECTYKHLSIYNDKVLKPSGSGKTDMYRKSSFSSSQNPTSQTFSCSFSSKEDDTKSFNNSLLDVSWIDHWRQKLDPIQQERERLIDQEERKKEILKKKKLEEFEILKKKIAENKAKDFPPLDNNILSKVESVLSYGNSHEVFAEGFNAKITRSDLATLRESTWLNDEVVNFYFNLIKQRSEGDKNLPKVHVFNTFFYPKIMNTGFSGVKRWTRKVDIFSMDVILIPVHLGMHWCLAVIDFKNKQFLYYDSLKGNNMKCLLALKGYLLEESRDKRKTEYSCEDWQMLMPKDIPEQLNGCDCGVFMCKYAEYKSRFANYTFTQSNMSYFRKRMIYEIMSKKLM